MTTAASRDTVEITREPACFRPASQNIAVKSAAGQDSYLKVEANSWHV